VCVRVRVCAHEFFYVCVVLCLGRGLVTGCSPVQGVLPSVKWSRNWEMSPMLQSGSERRKTIRVTEPAGMRWAGLLVCKKEKKFLWHFGWKTSWEDINSTEISVDEPICIWKIGIEYVGWTRLTHNRGQWRAFVNKVLSIQASPQRREIFLPS
jgi:hypothetical protein